MDLLPLLIEALSSMARASLEPSVSKTITDPGILTKILINKFGQNSYRSQALKVVRRWRNKIAHMAERPEPKELIDALRLLHEIYSYPDNEVTKLAKHAIVALLAKFGIDDELPAFVPGQYETLADIKSDPRAMIHAKNRKIKILSGHYSGQTATIQAFNGSNTKLIKQDGNLYKASNATRVEIDWN